MGRADCADARIRERGRVESMSMHRVKLVLSSAIMMGPPRLAENGAVPLEIRDRVLELDPSNGAVIMPDGFVTSVGAFEHLLAAMRMAMDHWERYQGLRLD